MKLTQEWVSAVAEDPQNKVAHINIRMNISAHRASNKYPYSIEICYLYDSPTLMPSPEDVSFIEEVDRRLQVAMERDKMAILVGNILEQGIKTWLYYSRTNAPFFDRLNDVLEDLPDLPLRFEVARDPAWSYYQQLIDELPSSSMDE